MAAQPLFGLLPAGQPLITTPSSQPSPTSFLYLIPHATPLNPKPFAHLAVFLLPGITLPENTAAAIYVALHPAALAPGGAGEAAANFKFLGGVGPGKESAVFKLGGIGGGENAEGVVIGISVEDAASVAERIQQTQAEHQAAESQQSSGGDGKTPSPQVLAQRIIQNAFNFLSGFSGQVGESGVEVVPLKAFQEWWRKFENKVKLDPSFLEKEQD
ncbi:hypothetical protein F5Y19DRAFT_381246 [Xylariaceae sp. FL1651]|nr:hypothetical protein F5Y19DRAFT_381246 [Xylariaceae sp. FL1651]